MDDQSMASMTPEEIVDRLEKVFRKAFYAIPDAIDQEFYLDTIGGE